jgi:hypothetical protein
LHINAILKKPLYSEVSTEYPHIRRKPGFSKVCRNPWVKNIPERRGQNAMLSPNPVVRDI